MRKQNRPITNDERKRWSTLGHLFALEGISEATEWTGKDFAFRGGTSLHLSWNSPRFSEDLDFLLEKRCAERLTRVMTNVKKHIEHIWLPLASVVITFGHPGNRIVYREDQKMSEKAAFLHGLSLKRSYFIGYLHFI